MTVAPLETDSDQRELWEIISKEVGQGRGLNFRSSAKGGIQRDGYFGPQCDDYLPFGRPPVEPKVAFVKAEVYDAIRRFPQKCAEGNRKPREAGGWKRHPEFNEDQTKLHQSNPLWYQPVSLRSINCM